MAANSTEQHTFAASGNSEKGISTSENYLLTQSCSKRKGKRRRNRKGGNKMSRSAIVPPLIGNASNCGWFWQNYYNALEWSERHQIAYWRSRSVALEYENTLLHQYVQNILDNGYHVSGNNKKPKWTSKTRKHEYSYKQKCQPEKLKDESESDGLETLEFQVNEDMMQFFEKSIKFKMEREKQKRKEMKDNESSSEDEFIIPQKQILSEKLEDMKCIYGEAAPMIMGMESAMQLSFEKHCDVHQPKLWPNLPLNM